MDDDMASYRTHGEVQADAKGRVSLGKASVAKGDRFVVRESRDAGYIVLERVVSVPASEIDLWNDPQLLEAVKLGLAEYTAGDVVEGEDFTQYIED